MIGSARTDALEAERSKIVALIVGVVGIALFLAGCGSQAGEVSSSPGTQERTATNEEPSISKPPESTFSFGDRIVSGELGSYCWSSAGSPTTCADAAGIPLPPEQQTLTVPKGSVLMFDYGGEGMLGSVEARAYPLEQEKKLLRGAEGTRLMRPKEGRSVLVTEDLRVRREGDRIVIPAELSSGEYVIEVLVRVPEGDASYYFRANVERRAGKLPTSDNLGRHDSENS